MVTAQRITPPVSEICRGMNLLDTPVLNKGTATALILLPVIFGGFTS